MTLNQQTKFQSPVKPKQTQERILPQIMIVDDDPELLEELKEGLLFNYEVETLSNSADAFDMACALNPDLIILDIKMSPKTGFQLANEFRTSMETKFIPIIAITGFFVEKEHTLMMKLFGVKRIIIKPFNLNQLLDQIEVALKESNPRWT